jgi:hypothetical protein
MDQYAKVYQLLGENFNEAEQLDVVIVGDTKYKFPTEDLANDFQKYLSKFSKIKSELTSGSGKDFSKEVITFRLGTDNVKRFNKDRDLGTSLFIYDKFKDNVKYRDKLDPLIGDRNLIVKSFLKTDK